jgi:hypothetical protein
MVRKTIRIHRQHSAFVYAILESLEGMTSYSTLPHSAVNFCDLSLSIAPSFAQDVDKVLDGMRKKFPIVEISGGMGTC